MVRPVTADDLPLVLEYSPIATAEMAKDMAGRLSPLDIREVKAGGNTPIKSLVAGVEQSRESWAYLMNGRPFVIAGIQEPGLVWMLSARDLKHPRAKWFFARRARRDLAERLARWGGLGNVIWKKNVPHMRLLEWLGFEFGETVQINGHDYLKFWSKSDV